MKWAAAGLLLGSLGAYTYLESNTQAPNWVDDLEMENDEELTNLNAQACSDSEGWCSERVVHLGDAGAWGMWRGPSEAGRYACGFTISKPSYGWLDDNMGIKGLKFKYCKSDSWYIQEEVEVAQPKGENWWTWRMCPEYMWISIGSV